MIYGRSRLLQWVYDGGIEPFNESMLGDRLNEHCIDVSIGYVHDGFIETLPPTPLAEPFEVEIPPLGFRLGLLAESVQIPVDAVGEFTIRSCYARQGLGQALSKDIKAGWSGHLVVELFNYSGRSIVLRNGDRIGQISLHSLK